MQILTAVIVVADYAFKHYVAGIASTFWTQAAAASALLVGWAPGARVGSFIRVWMMGDRSFGGVGLSGGTGERNARPVTSLVKRMKVWRERAHEAV